MPTLVHITDDVLKAEIQGTSDADELCEWLFRLRDKRRYADPAFLERLLEIDDEWLQQELAAAASLSGRSKR